VAVVRIHGNTSRLQAAWTSVFNAPHRTLTDERQRALFVRIRLLTHDVNLSPIRIDVGELVSLRTISVFCDLCSHHLRNTAPSARQQNKGNLIRATKRTYFEEVSNPFTT
jgi:hypothetical protein